MKFSFLKMKMQFKVDRGHFANNWNYQKNISVQIIVHHLTTKYLCTMFVNIPIAHITSALERSVWGMSWTC
jgi:hypothetical protein